MSSATMPSRPPQALTFSNPADAGLPDPRFSVPPSAVPAAPPCAVTVDTDSTVPVGPVTVVVVAPLPLVKVEVVLPVLLLGAAALPDGAYAVPMAEIPLMMPCPLRARSCTAKDEDGVNAEASNDARGRNEGSRAI